jgi:hypothetical protein
MLYFQNKKIGAKVQLARARPFPAPSRGILPGRRGLIVLRHSGGMPKSTVADDRCAVSGRGYRRITVSNRDLSNARFSVLMANVEAGECLRVIG